MLKAWHKYIYFLHVQISQTLKVDNLCIFQMCFFPTKCAPFFLKIEEDFNIDDIKGKRIWIDENYLKIWTHLV
jgi:hypothetical protein